MAFKRGTDTGPSADVTRPMSRGAWWSLQRVWEWSRLERPPAQILVVVAIIQTSTLNT